MDSQFIRELYNILKERKKNSESKSYTAKEAINRLARSMLFG